MSSLLMCKVKGFADHFTEGKKVNRFSLNAAYCMGALVAALLITNYFSQRTLALSSIDHLQHNLDDTGRFLSYFLDECKADVRELSESPTVQAYFANQALGMSPKYGLQVSLNSISRRFAYYGEERNIVEKPIYFSLWLLDIEGAVLARWPSYSLVEYTDVPDPEVQREGVVTMNSHSSGVAQFTAPVFRNNKLCGYIRSWVDFAPALAHHIEHFQGRLFLADSRHVIFYSQDSETPPGIEGITLTSDTDIPIDIPGLHVMDLEGERGSFTTNVPGYDLKVILRESHVATAAQRNVFTLMVGLIILSVTGFVISLAILRADKKRIILETSLGETKKQQKIIAAKNEEFELVIDAAQLGTFSVDMLTGDVEVNNRMAEMLGYRKKGVNISIDSWKRLIHPEDVAQVEKALHSHIAGGNDRYFSEHRLRHRSGRWIWVFSTGKILQWDGDGNPVRAFGIHLDITYRKEATFKLQKAKEESDRIIRDFLDTLIVVDKEMCVSRANNATCRMLGYSEDEITGMPVSQLFHDSPEIVEQYFSLHTPDMAKDAEPMAELRNIELCYRGKNGERLPMSFNIRVLRNESGIAEGVVAGAKDVSRLRTALDEIERQRNYIESLFDLLPNGLLAVSKSGQIISRNRAADTIFQEIGIDVGDSGKSQPYLQKEVVETFLQNKNKKEATVLSFYNANGPVHLRCSISNIEGVEHIDSVISIENITNERESESARRLLSTVVDHMADSVLVTDTDGIILYANPATYRNTGYKEKDLIGSHTSIFSHGQVKQSVYDELWQAIGCGTNWKGRLINSNKDGRAMEEEVTISPVRSAMNRITHFVAIKRDITEMETLQRQLIHAQKMEAIGQLAAGIAHEINTPMQYIQNNISFLQQGFDELSNIVKERLQEERDDSEQQISLDVDGTEFLLSEIPEGIEEAQEGVDRVVRIVGAMKNFSHPEGAKKTPTDINRALESTIAVSRHEWKYVADVVTDFEENLPMVHCFPGQFNQVILNLIINAAHAIEETGDSVSGTTPGSITISTRQRNDKVEIKVDDTGCGIPKAIADRIFEPFFTTKEVGKGTGQGLSLVHDIVVVKHGGTISVHPASGGGTSFIISIPVVDSRKSKREEAFLEAVEV